MHAGLKKTGAPVIAFLCIFLVSTWGIDIVPAWIYFAVFITPNMVKADGIIMPLYLLISHVIPPAAAGILSTNAAFPLVVGTRTEDTPLAEASAWRYLIHSLEDFAYQTGQACHLSTLSCAAGACIY